MMLNSKKLILFLKFECVTHRRHKRLNATTNFGKLFVTLCNRAELNHIHALNGSSFIFSNGFVKPIQYASAVYGKYNDVYSILLRIKHFIRLSVMFSIGWAIELYCTDLELPFIRIPISPCFVEF